MENPHIKRIFNKNLIILCLFLFSILLILNNPVSATDIHINNTTDEGIKEYVNDNSYDTIYLADGIYSGENNTKINITGRNSNLKIIGNSSENTIIDGSNSYIFGFYDNNNNPYNITLINITFTNTFGPACEYMVKNGLLTIENCTFKDNFGDGVLNIKSETNVNINNSYFISNEKAMKVHNSTVIVSNSNFTDHEQGAISSQYSNLTIIKSNFTENLGQNGGAINSEYSKVDIVNCTFNENEARYGGAILSKEDNLTINNSIFYKNRADYGGAIYYNSTIHNYNLIINNSNFTENYGGFGGVIYSYFGNITIKNNNFTKNEGEYGGAAYIEGNYIEILSNFFYANYVDHNGAALYLSAHNDDFNFLINHNIFYENYCGILGGYILYCKFDNNGIDYNGNFSGDYNWWGINLLPQYAFNHSSSTINYKINNNFITILNTTEKEPLYINSVVNYDYYMVLNTSNDTYYNKLLPYFITTITHINGNIEEIDSRFHKSFQIIPGKLGNLEANSTSHDQINVLNFNISDLKTKINTTSPNQTYYNETVVLEASLLDQNGKKIANMILEFYVNGKWIGNISTDNNGYAYYNYPIKSMEKIQWYAQFTAKSDDGYIGSESEIKTIEILKKQTIITTNNVSTKVGKTINLKAILTDEQGNLLVGEKVIFTIGTKELIGYIDANGIANVSYYSEKEGKVKFSVKFTGNEYYYESEVEAIIIIKKDSNSSNDHINNINNSNKTNNTNKIDETNKNTIIYGNMKKTGFPIAILLVFFSSLIILIKKID